MELFSEIYGLYYLVVRKILEKANLDTLDFSDISKIINENAFSESSFFIIPNLENGEWDFFDSEKNCKLESDKFELPITNLQKSWLRAILNDRRIKIFLDRDEIEELKTKFSDIEELFDYDDFYIFDKNLGGDNFENQEYIKNFRILLDCIKEYKFLEIEYKNKNDRVTKNIYKPIKINYSEKDDKFRLIAYRVFNKKKNFVKLNISSIVSAEIKENNFLEPRKNQEDSTFIKIKLYNERNALERFMLQFAQYEKETEAFEKEYISKIYYDRADETELLIRILSFGPVLKVIEPEFFVNEIRKRLQRQMELYEIKQELL